MRNEQQENEERLIRDEIERLSKVIADHDARTQTQGYRDRAAEEGRQAFERLEKAYFEPPLRKDA